MSDRLYRVIPVDCGHCTVGEHHLFGDPHSDDDRVLFALYAFLADAGPGRRVLVDLGPVGLPYLNDMFRRFKFFRELPGDPDAIVQPRGNVFDGLARLGLSPEDIDHVVFTHMHADHHGLTDGTDGGGGEMFPNARFHVSKIGWENNLALRVGGQWNSYVDYAFSDFILEQGEKGRVIFHDDDVVIDGVDVIYLNGHEICSQAVRIQTACGPAIVTSDDVYAYQFLERGVLGRLRTSTENLLAATDKLVDLALAGAILLPCHDPVMAQLYEEHGEDWLEHLRPISDRAARCFRNSQKTFIG